MIPVTYSKLVPMKGSSDHDMQEIKNCLFIEIHIVEDEPKALIVTPEGGFELVELFRIKAQLQKGNIVTPNNFMR